VRSGRHAAGALDAAVLRLKRAGMRLRLWAVWRGPVSTAPGRRPRRESPAAILKVF